MAERETLRQRVQAAVRDEAVPVAERARKAAEIRASAVVEAFRDHPGRNERGVLAVRVRGAEVAIGRVELRRWPDGNTSVEVWTGPDGDRPPDLRVFNPPTLVADPRGDVAVVGKLPNGRRETRRYREDPVAALAEVVAGLGKGGVR